MLSEQQLQQIQARGVAVETFETQLENFKKGFPYLTIEAAATPAKGIKVLSEDEQAKYISVAENYGGNVCKFVPASLLSNRSCYNKGSRNASRKMSAPSRVLVPVIFGKSGIICV